MLSLGLSVTSLGVLGGQGSSGPVIPDGALLLMITGQSNSRVAGNSSATPPAKYSSLGDAQILVKGSGVSDATFQAYDVNTNADPDNTGTAWGSEAEFIYQMRQNGDDRTVYIVKQSRNGQTLFEQWNPSGTNNQFTEFEEKVTRARALISGGFGEELIVWNQGEADSNVGAGPNNDGTAADSYATNFTAWFSAIRSRVSAGARVIVQRIRPLGYDAGDGVATEAGWPRAWTVREAQISSPIADGNATTIDTDFIPGNFGNIHPPEPWTEGMGLRTYAAYRGTYTGTYGAITDTAPNAFDFTDQTGVGTSSQIVSDAVLLAGYQRRSTVTATGCEFRTLNSLNSDSVVSDWATSGVIDPFQKLQLRATSSSSLDTEVVVSVSVGGVSADWSITTTDTVASFEPETDAFTAQVVTNGGLTISGAQKDALDDFYVTAKASTWWAKTLRLFLRLADETSSSLNLADQSTVLLNPSDGGTTAMTWSSAGWTRGDVTRSYLDLQVNPSKALPQDSCGVAVWVSTLPTEGTPLISSDDGTIFMRYRDGSNGSSRVKLHQSGNSNFTPASASAGMVALVREDASTLKVYGHVGTEITSQSRASITPTATNLVMGTVNGGVADAVWQGGGAFNAALTQPEAASLASAVSTLHAAFAA